MKSPDATTAPQTAIARAIRRCAIRRRAFLRQSAAASAGVLGLGLQGEAGPAIPSRNCARHSPPQTPLSSLHSHMTRSIHASRRLVITTILFTLAFFRSAAAEVPAKLPPKENFHLFLLVGQSNMAGRGIVTPEDQTPHPRVLMLSKAGEWTPAIDPMHSDKSSAGVGLGKAFGAQIAEANPGITIGLIPCAVGGSPIDTWQPGVFYAATKSHPWDDAMQRAHPALKGGTLKGILWHQGESDSTDKLAPGYEAKLHDLIARLRKELDAPEVPFIAGQMGLFAESPWNDAKKQVDKAHQDLPKTVKHAAFVSAAGLNHKGDKLHFDAASYREFGKRYAEAFAKLTKEQKAPAR